jgi:alkanesulfonate monooxygenase SsuD/methylene tetrahydromethanopterin reductase-like flavin-dependent oxidoreductase (luciferase family)
MIRPEPRRAPGSGNARGAAKSGDGAGQGRAPQSDAEAHDLILKAMSTTDGPFNWEGEFFHYRNVNIWPRPYQQPTPPVWMTGLSTETGRMAAERGHVVGTLLSLSAAGPMFEAYRKRA